MATIYILEDDLNIQEIEAYALKNSGYQTEGFDNAREFFKKVSESAEPFAAGYYAS